MMLAGALVPSSSQRTMETGRSRCWHRSCRRLRRLLMTLTITRLDANEIIVGLGFNILIAGLVRFFLKSAYGTSGTLSLPDTTRIPRIDIPFVADIPSLGAIFSGHDVLTWLAWALVPSRHGSSRGPGPPAPARCGRRPQGRARTRP